MQRARREVQLRSFPVVLIAIVLALAGTGAGVALGLGHPAGRPRVSGALLDRRVPRLELESSSGGATSLASFRGKVVVLAPFLTLCHEVCPLTTGAFGEMRRLVRQSGLGGRVVFAEVSVDPWRDTPARLRAFARLTGVRFRLLTGTPAELARFWSFFGVGYRRTREGSPPDRDWLTHRPLTFDVTHTDGLFLLDARGHERIVDVGMPDAGGRLSPALRRLLNGTGRRNLSRPEAGWTIRQGLDDVGYLLGSTIPAD